jgi:hypothetical protein
MLVLPLCNEAFPYGYNVMNKFGRAVELIKGLG